MHAEYDRMADRLKADLAEAVARDREDRSFYSPLHCAIRAVGAWRVTEAAKELLSVIDYHIDVRTIPQGMNILGQDLYPAAPALVQVRVPPNELIDPIAQAKTPRQVRLLTWVLRQRTGSAEHAQFVLTASRRFYRTSANLDAAAALLKRGEDSLREDGTP